MLIIQLYRCICFGLQKFVNYERRGSRICGVVAYGYEKGHKIFKIL